MTYEYAVYFKLLLLCGYSDELQNYIDNALIEQNPLSDIVLELSQTNNNAKTALFVLNQYLSNVNDTDIDYDNVVFNLIMDFLKKEYTSGNLNIKEITDLMYKIALNTNREFQEPWQTMYYLGDFYGEAEEGYFDMDDFKRKFDAFINDKIYIFNDTETKPKLSFFQMCSMLLKSIFRRK
jgi:hypothetical protein